MAHTHRKAFTAIGDHRSSVIKGKILKPTQEEKTALKQLKKLSRSLGCRFTTIQDHGEIRAEVRAPEGVTFKDGTDTLTASAPFPYHPPYGELWTTLNREKFDCHD